MALGTLSVVECIRNVKVLVPLTDLLICHRDLWLPWVLQMGPKAVVAHGGEVDVMLVEGAMARAEGVCRIHSPFSSFSHASIVLYGSAHFLCFLCSRYSHAARHSTAQHMLYSMDGIE